jgi:hypothetical protein
VFVAALLVGGDALQVALGLPSALARFMLWAVLYGAIVAQSMGPGLIGARRGP